MKLISKRKNISHRDRPNHMIHLVVKDIQN